MSAPPPATSSVKEEAPFPAKIVYPPDDPLAPKH
jgi:hypothetical protein